MRHPAARAALLEAAQRLSASGLTPGTSGNVSVRVEGGLLVTPTGMPYGILRVDDLVELSLEGDVVEGHRAPSSEWHMEFSA